LSDNKNNTVEVSYLAVPYSHPDPAVVQSRVDAIDELASVLISKGHFIFSPISMCHGMAMKYGLPGDWEFWRKYNTEMMGRCQKLVVLCIDGWKESVGVKAEIEIATEMGLPVEYVCRGTCS